MERLRYLAVEGPIGVGKTSLAQMLAEDLKGSLILEEASENPFLSSFYQNPNQFAFQAQVFFLLSRYRQQILLKQQDLFSEVAVCDYLFARDKIFASLTLTTEEMELYLSIYKLLDERIAKPDLVILLQADPDTLISRIKRRKIDYEKGLTPEYVQSVAQAYSRYFFQYTETPLLVVNTTGIDFVKNKKDYDTLKKELYHMWKSGIPKHYVTIDSR